MPRRSLLLFIGTLAVLPLLPAQTPFPGLRAILSEAEWQRAGLERLTPDQLGVIDAALIRHHRAATAGLQQEVAQARAQVAEADAAETTRSWRERFGLGTRSAGSWRDQPPLLAKVTGWRGANRFVLDNGQVWEGQDPIPYELVGRSIAIEARPAGAFALTVDGQTTALRVRRIQ